MKKNIYSLPVVEQVILDFLILRWQLTTFLFKVYSIVIVFFSNFYLYGNFSLCRKIKIVRKFMLFTVFIPTSFDLRHQLPSDLLPRILSFLALDELVQLSPVSKWINSLVKQTITVMTVVSFSRYHDHLPNEVSKMVLSGKFKNCKSISGANVKVCFCRPNLAVNIF